jgi:hypothetical protein
MHFYGYQESDSMVGNAAAKGSRKIKGLCVDHQRVSY